MNNNQFWSVFQLYRGKCLWKRGIEFNYIEET